MTSVPAIAARTRRPLRAPEAHAHALGADLPGQVATGAGADAGAPHQASMVMLCVVMLAAAALTLLVLLTGGLSRPLLPTAFRPAVVRARAPVGPRDGSAPRVAVLRHQVLTGHMATRHARASRGSAAAKGRRSLPTTPT